MTGADVVECEEDQMMCADHKKCILHVYVCDGVNNCGDWSDEAECNRQYCRKCKKKLHQLQDLTFFQARSRTAVQENFNAPMETASMGHGNVMETWTVLTNQMNSIAVSSLPWVESLMIS